MIHFRETLSKRFCYGLCGRVGANGCNDLVTDTFDSLLIRGLNEADLWAVITEFSYVT